MKTLAADLLIALGLTLGACWGIVESRVLYDEDQRLPTRWHSFWLCLTGIVIMTIGGTIIRQASGFWLGFFFTAMAIIGGLFFAWYKAAVTGQRVLDVLRKMMRVSP